MVRRIPPTRMATSQGFTQLLTQVGARVPVCALAKGGVFMVFERVVVRMQELLQGEKTQYRSEQTNKQTNTHTVCTHSLTHSLTHARTYALTNTSLSPYFSACGACPDLPFQNAEKVPVLPQHNYPPLPPLSQFTRYGAHPVDKNIWERCV